MRTVEEARGRPDPDRRQKERIRGNSSNVKEQDGGSDCSTKYGQSSVRAR